MPKRLCNSKGKTQARFGQIRIGWHKRKMLSRLENLDEANQLGKLEEEAKVKFENLKQRAFKVLPKRFLRRIQGR